MPLSKTKEKEVLQVYHTWLDSYLNGDVETYNSYFDDEYHFIGSTDNEEFLNRKDTTEFFRATADQLSGKAELRNESKVIEQFGDLIFITHLFDAWFFDGSDWAFYSRFRFTNALRKNADGWRFIYQHYSTPDTKAQDGETIGFDQVSAENQQLREAVKRRTVELEQKNRELEIESALERVRYRAVAMRHSDELSEAAELLYKEFLKMGVESFSCGYLINDEEKQEWKVWLTNPGEPFFKEFWTVPYAADQNLKARYDSWQRRDEEGFHCAVLTGEENRSHHMVISKYAPWKAEMLDDLPAQLVFNSAHFSMGHLLVISPERLTPELEQAMERFAGVFDLAYLRFLDLQKAEAQAREAQIESALERIRAQVSYMQESSDLLDIVVAMRKEFVRLGHEAHYFWHMRWHPEKYEKAMTSGDGTRIGMVMELPRRIHGEIPELAEWEKSDEPTVIFAMDINTTLDYVHKMGAWGDFERIDPNMPTDDDLRHIGGLTYVMARTSLGEIGYSLPGIVKTIPQPELDILIRFARAFDLAHKRFEDLKTRERQTLNIIAEKERLEKTLIELQATQKQLIQSEKMASLGELTAGIAHEIQNPLNFVNNFSEVSTELLDEMNDELKNGDLDEVKAIAHDIKLNLQKINHHGKRADGIVKGMLQHSRTNKGEKKATDINELADEYLRLAYHGLRAKDKTFNAQLDTEFDPTLGAIEIIPQDMGRVFLNMINNAFYAVHEKRRNNGSGFQPTVTISTKKFVDHITVTVQDNGNGISQPVLDKIFQPFFTTKPTGQGTGLGLSLSYDIVKAHGGEIKVKSQVKEGTEFTIYLPLHTN